MSKLSRAWSQQVSTVRAGTATPAWYPLAQATGVLVLVVTLGWAVFAGDSRTPDPVTAVLADPDTSAGPTTGTTPDPTVPPTVPVSSPVPDTGELTEVFDRYGTPVVVPAAVNTLATAAARSLFDASVVVPTESGTALTPVDPGPGVVVAVTVDQADATAKVYTFTTTVDLDGPGPVGLRTDTVRIAATTGGWVVRSRAHG